MTRPVIVLDIETNGTDVAKHDAWEVSWWNVSTGERDTFLPYIDPVNVFLHNSELPGLRVSRFVDRWTPERLERERYSRSEADARVRHLNAVCWGDGPQDLPDREYRKHHAAVMVCAQPKFDLPFVTKLFNAASDDWVLESEPWFYRAIDLASYACGGLGLDPTYPPGHADVCRLLGIPTGDHTAEGDVTATGRAYLALRELALTGGTTLEGTSLEALARGQMLDDGQLRSLDALGGWGPEIAADADPMEVAR